MQDYTVVDRVNSRGYAEFLAQSYGSSWVVQNEDGRWEVRIPRAHKS